MSIMCHIPAYSETPGNEYSPFRPIFNNCDNCTITFNVNYPSDPRTDTEGNSHLNN